MRGLLYGTMAALMVALISAGCSKPGGDFKTAKQIKAEKQAAGVPDHHDDHEHGAGPHGGAIVELGDDEYHAEVVVDGKTDTVRVYLLGTDAKTITPVAAKEATIVTEKQKKLVLKAVPQEGDGEGKASQFELTDEAEVDPIVKVGYLHGSFQIDINGKPYRGDVDAHFDGSTHDDHAGDKDAEMKKEDSEDSPSEPTKDEEKKADAEKSEN